MERGLPHGDAKMAHGTFVEFGLLLAANSDSSLHMETQFSARRYGVSTAITDTCRGGISANGDGLIRVPRHRYSEYQCVEDLQRLYNIELLVQQKKSETAS